MINAIDRLRFDDRHKIPECHVTKPSSYTDEYDMMVRSVTKQHLRNMTLTYTDETFCANVPYKWPVWVGGNYDFCRRQHQPFHLMRELRHATMLEE